MSQMFHKLKDKLKIQQGDSNLQVTQSRHVDISVLNEEQIKVFLATIQDSKENLQTLQQLTTNNRRFIREYIKSQEEAQKNKEPVEGEEDDDQESYTFPEDILEIKEVVKQLTQQIRKILDMQTQIKKKILSIESQQSLEKLSALEGKIQQKEKQLVELRKSDENYKEILNTLTQQKELYKKETVQLQDKNVKIQKQLKETTGLLNNLREEKLVLLEMRNTDSVAKNPELQALKIQLSEFQKRLSLEKTKNQQKEKQIQHLKKKLDDDRQSLEKIADELKEKQIKSKKIIDKYERSKTEIRKFRQQKNEFIKKLNMQMADVNQKYHKVKAQNEALSAKIKEHQLDIESLQADTYNNQSKAIQLDSTKIELSEVRQQIIEVNSKIQEHIAQNKILNQANEQLQAKRKSLLQALQKPIKHQIRTLEKISKALQKLYKEYITTVFEQGNIVGFENKIMTLKSNIQDIKQDLLI